MKKRVVLFADQDKVLTNGQVYGKQVFLAESESAGDYYEITAQEYEKIKTANEELISP